MRDVMMKITAFHKKNGLGIGNRITEIPFPEAQVLRTCAGVMKEMSAPLRDGTNPRSQRVGYCLEETGELAAALADGDETAILDALADLIYVVAGTAVAFGLPLPEAFDEVHNSNMSKTRKDQGFRDKGPDYRPPDIVGVIEEHRR